MNDQAKIKYIQDRLAPYITPLPSEEICLEIFEIAEAYTNSGCRCGDFVSALIRFLLTTNKTPIDLYS